MFLECWNVVYMHFAMKCIYLWQFTLHCYTLLEEPLVWQWVFALVCEKHGLCNLIALNHPFVALRPGLSLKHKLEVMVHVANYVPSVSSLQCCTPVWEMAAHQCCTPV